MTIGGTLTVLVVMTSVSWGQSSLIGRAAPRYQAVTSVIVHALSISFFTMTTWCLVGGFAITAIALLSGPCRLATALPAGVAPARTATFGELSAHGAAEPRA
jgi:hypothetical protein